MDIPTRQVPGLYHRRVGDVLVTTLLDGHNDIPYADIENFTASEAAQRLTADFQPAPPVVPVHCFLLRTKDHAALVDLGFGEPRGELLKLLAATGVSADEITTILLTHMHPDHSCGLRRGSGEAAFPNAEVVVAEEELRHWDNDGAMERATERQRTRYFEAARYQIGPYRDRLRNAKGQVWQDVTAVPMPGHTPGHTGYMIDSGGERLLIWGDLCHIPGLQLPYPHLKTSYDSLPDLAVESRMRILEWVEAERIPVAGMHLHFPGFASIVKRDAGYWFIQEPWRFTC